MSTLEIKQRERNARPTAEGRGGGGGKGGGKAKTPTEAPNTLRSRAVARVVDVVSEGPIGGLVNGMKSIYFDNTPLQNADGSFNFSGVEVAERIGSPYQDPAPGTPATESSEGVGAQVKRNEPVVRTIQNANVDAVRVTVRIPALMNVEDDGDIVGTSVSIAIDVQSTGDSWIEQVADTIHGKTTSPYDVAYRIELPPGGSPWNVRVRRLTDDSSRVTLSNDTYWAFYTEIIDHRLIYPDTAYYAVSADAEAFGGAIPSRSYEIYGQLMKVPSNYDPFTRAYDGDWDGQFKESWSDNPAWVFYMMATHTRFGLGQWIEESTVSKWALYEIAKYCDELVPDGFGGMEPRFRFNGTINTREDALKVLQLIASCFRGMGFWAGGSIVATQDRPTDPIILVSPANVIDGHFEYSGTGFKSRHSVALVTWNDPEDAYRQAIEAIEDPDLIDKYGWRPAEVVAYGCTSRGQAHRVGKWLLDSEKHENQLVVYRASFDHMVADGTAVMPGDVILLQDPSFSGVRFGGRIAQASVSEVTIDAPVTLESGQTYTLHVVLPDGTLGEVAVDNSPGETTTLTLAQNLPTAPQSAAMWVITASNVAPRQFRVVGVRETEKNIVEVTALLHDPTKYVRVEQGIILEKPAFSIVGTGPLVAPTDMTFHEYLYRVGPTSKAAVTVSWSPPANEPRVSYYEVQIRRPGEAFGRYQETTDIKVDIDDTVPGSYGFRVRAIDPVGNKSPWLTRDPVALLALNQPPENVLGFNMQIVGDSAHLSWLPVMDAHLSYYRIKFQAVLTGASWGGGTILVDRVSRDATGITVPAMVGTYMIKAVTTSGIQSVTAALVTSNVSSLRGFNAVATVREDPEFTGTKNGVVVDDDVLILASNGAEGFVSEGVYNFSQVTDLTDVYTSRLTAQLTAFGANTANVMSSWVRLSDVERLSGTDPEEWDVVLQTSITNGDPNDPEAVWSEWQDFVVGDYTGRGFRFRLVLRTERPFVTPRVITLRTSIDMPDRVDGHRNVFCPVDGIRVQFEPAFGAAPAVAITLQGAAEGDQVVLSNETAEGFDVQVMNDTVGVERTFNWIARGYGFVGG